MKSRNVELMRIELEVAGKKVEFRRNWFTGSAVVVVEGATKPLADPLDPSTHFTASRVDTWAVTLYGHRVEIKKTRPLLFAGFRPQHYIISVDGASIVERTGY